MIGIFSVIGVIGGILFAGALGCLLVLFALAWIVDYATSEEIGDDTIEMLCEPDSVSGA